MPSVMTFKGMFIFKLMLTAVSPVIFPQKSVHYRLMFLATCDYKIKSIPANFRSGWSCSKQIKCHQKSQLNTTANYWLSPQFITPRWSRTRYTRELPSKTGAMLMRHAWGDLTIHGKAQPCFVFFISFVSWVLKEFPNITTIITTSNHHLAMGRDWK